ncbi:hypothetical protein BDZ89DRAFT_1137239 [Hymenopellis radicata]|nr:hypothetical protein BDZ89DRAFT_1137239 [Hymenopellis radicata]
MINPCPGSPPLIAPDPREAIWFDFMILYDIRDRPVMLVEIKHSDEGCVKAELRAKADEWMRRQLGAQFGECQGLPRLWGLSLIETSLRVYRVMLLPEILNPLLKVIGAVIFPMIFLKGVGAWIFFLRRDSTK